MGKQKNPTGKAKEEDADDLFTIDTKDSFEGISKTSRRQLARAKLFPPKGPNIGMTSTEEAKIARAERQLEASRRPKPPKAPEVYDLWAEPASSQASGKNPNLLTAKDQGRPRPVRKPRTMHRKAGLAPAVIPAHEGQSMNPHREAYEDLACMAAAAQIEKEREDEELDRKMRPMTHALRDLVGEEKLKEMDEEEKMRLFRSLNVKETSGGLSGAHHDGEGGLKGTRKWMQKSQSFRNRQDKQRDADAKEEQVNDQKALERSVGEVGNILKTMQEKADLQKSRKQYRESMRAKRRELEATTGAVPKKRKIGGGKFAEEAAAVPDADAGARGLRAMPLRTSALRERLSSVVRRGLLPPPAESSREKRHWYKKKSNKLKRSRKNISPLLKDNLLLR